MSANVKALDLTLIRRLWTYVHPHRRLIWLGLGLLLATMGFRLALPYAVARAIDDHIMVGDARGFWGWVALFSGCAVAEYFTRRWQMVLVDTAGQNALLDLRKKLFRHLQELPSRFFDRTPTGRLVGRVTTDIEALQEMFSSGVVTILGDVVFLIATLWILLAIHWQLTLVALLVVPVLMLVTVYVRSIVRLAYIELRTKISALNAYLHEQISGMPVLQMFRREDVSRAGFRDINYSVRESQLAAVRWESALSAVTEMLGSLTTAAILWYGGRVAIAGLYQEGGAPELGLTLGTLFLFTNYMTKFFQPLTDLSLKYTVMQNAMTASDRIFRLMDEGGKIPEPAQPAVVPAARGRIEFDRVAFRYEDNKPVLRELSFSLEEGERVAVVGATGAGKSTILNLLTRLYDVQGGAIRLDGVDVRDYSLHDLRQRIAVIPQDVFLFEGDVLENIRLGHPEIPEERARQAARELGLEDMLQRFPNGIREPVRERGKNLSAGEKQLIAFARVLALQPSVLVMDEATSNVDSHTEHVLQEAVHKIMTGRTSLIIAHRLSTIRDVDRILVLKQGELLESGAHQELLDQEGAYWHLYNLQYKDQEEAPPRAG